MDTTLLHFLKNWPPCGNIQQLSQDAIYFELGRRFALLAWEVCCFGKVDQAVSKDI
jgi:hypothetical protein